MVCTDVMGFSKNFEEKLIFHFQINWSGLPVLTLGKHPKNRGGPALKMLFSLRPVDLSRSKLRLEPRPPGPLP